MKYKKQSLFCWQRSRQEEAAAASAAAISQGL
jgi:hypothetical protein